MSRVAGTQGEGLKEAETGEAEPLQVTGNAASSADRDEQASREVCSNSNWLTQRSGKERMEN